MRFGYSYKTSDATWHEDEIEAKDRESVFASLKSRGIRPIKVWEKEARRTYKRWIAIGVLSVAVVVLAVSLGRSNGPAVASASEVTEVAIRHYIPGIDCSPANVSRIFSRPSEAYLALYAMPGEPVKAPTFNESLARDFADNIGKKVVADKEDAPETSELRAVVAGMKEELVRYMRIGGGVRDYVRMLETRQQTEQAHRAKTIEDFRRQAKGLSDEDRNALVTKTDEHLRVMGMREMGVAEK